MNIIWANRLIAGTKTWAEMPASRRAGVKKVLAERVNKGEITAEDYKRITCEKLLTRLEAQGENMSTERAEFGVLMVDCAMRGCGADPGMKGDGSNGD